MSAFLCEIPEGDDIARNVINALTKCEMVVIMGSKTYGKETSSRYSTFQELRFIDDERKPFFLIKMCDKFEEAETRFRLNDSIAFIKWMPGKRKLLLLLLFSVLLCVYACVLLYRRLPSAYPPPVFYMFSFLLYSHPWGAYC